MVVAQSGVLIALALVFSYVEHIIPIPIPMPGVKLGLANLVTLTGLFFLNPLQVFIILVARILLAGFMFGNLSTIIYSLAGGIISFCLMYGATKLKAFSPLGISLIGGVFHNMAQLGVACLILKSTSLLAYLPVLMLSGITAGALIGIVSKTVSAYVNRRIIPD
ncbi:MAG: Gx transporter family protein [Lachnospiraceae bacterium]|nr:Gx transporter family protein [Lachnospiraceae bacterium]